MTLAIHKWGADHLPAIFCVHGWAMNAQVFEPLATLFEDRFQFIAVDLPGYGDSACDDPESDYDLPVLMQKLMDVAPPTAHWLGWSLGGMLAIQAAAQFPARVEQVMTLCSNAKFLADKRWPKAVPEPLYKGFMDEIDDVRTTLRRFAALTVVGEQQNMLQSLKWLQEHGQTPKPNSDVLKASLILLSKLDNRPVLKALKRPCLHMLATNDAIVPHALSPLLNQLNPYHLVSFVPNGSHASLVTQPQSVANGILTFLQGGQVGEGQ